jgi:hypothetical protein
LPPHLFTPHPALRATFSLQEKDFLKISQIWRANAQFSLGALRLPHSSEVTLLRRLESNFLAYRFRKGCENLFVSAESRFNVTKVFQLFLNLTEAFLAFAGCFRKLRDKGGLSLNQQRHSLFEMTAPSVRLLLHDSSILRRLSAQVMVHADSFLGSTEWTSVRT